MCGIFGHVGAETMVMPMAASALRRMEYRGYDSWGIGWDDGVAFTCLKGTGRVPRELPNTVRSTLTLGHTRWATHGGVTEENAHPHLDCMGQIALVHNGVVENAVELRHGLHGSHVWRSETDSEVIAHLVESELAAGASLACSVASVFRRLEGTNAVVVAERSTGELAAVTSRSPLRLGRGGGGYILASDALALVDLAEEIAVIPDNALLTLSSVQASLSNVFTGEPIDLEWTTPPREQVVDVGSYSHFTNKEIHEQPSVIRALLDCADDVQPLADLVRQHSHVILTGCGSAFYAASMGAIWLEHAATAWIDVVPATELTAAKRNRGADTLLIALTQSGETADVIDAIHIARAWGATTAALVNAPSSSVSRLVDVAVPLLAGPERSVLATKSFMAMAVRLIQVADALQPGPSSVSSELCDAVCLLEQMLGCDAIHDVAARLGSADHVLVLGKGVGHKVALEAALKVKEGSYVHAEAFLTGELKHGPLALVSDGTPCVLFAASPGERDAARIASREVMSRGGYTIGIGGFSASDCSSVIPLPDREFASALVALGIAQRVAYETAIARGVDPDFPRNLAKSVTVR